MSHSPAETAASHRDNEAGRVANSAAELSRLSVRHYVAEPATDLLSLMRNYAREKPDVAAIWAFGLGVIIGWKIKPWR